MAVGMSHPKVKLFVGDGLEYLQKEETKYDVVIADLSDPDDGGINIIMETCNYGHWNTRKKCPHFELELAIQS